MIRTPGVRLCLDKIASRDLGVESQRRRIMNDATVIAQTPEMRCRVCIVPSL